MKNAISPSVGESAHNEDAVGTKSRSKRSLKAVAAVAATAIAVGSVGVTAANWTDSEVVGSELSSGHFDMEISVDDGATWHTQTVENGALDLSMSSIFADSAPWGPGETRTSEVLLRLSDETTHLGAFILDEMVSVEGSGDVDDYSWSITDTSHESFSECGDGRNAAALFSGDSLDEAEPGADTYSYPASQRPISFDTTSLGRIPIGHPTLMGVSSAQTMALCFEVSSGTDLAENGGAGAEWTLSVEQSTYQDIAMNTFMKEVVEDPYVVRDLQEIPYSWAALVSSAYTLFGDADIARSAFEDAGLIEYLPNDIEWTLDGMADVWVIFVREFVKREPDEAILMDYNGLAGATERDPEYHQETYGTTSPEAIMRLSFGDDLFDLILERYDITLPQQ